MFGEDRIHAVIASVRGEERFNGLEPVGLELQGLDRHQRLLASYKKLHSWRLQQSR